MILYERMCLKDNQIEKLYKYMKDPVSRNRSKSKASQIEKTLIQYVVCIKNAN